MVSEKKWGLIITVSQIYSCELMDFL